MAVITIKPKDVEATLDLNFLIRSRLPEPKAKPERKRKDEEKKHDGNNC